MSKSYRKGAIGALLDEYERTISELQNVINDISEEELAKIVDRETIDPNCVSIQAILSHVVKSGYSYCNYIEQLGSGKMIPSSNQTRRSVNEYQKDLDEVFLYTVETFKDLQDDQLEDSGNGKKIITSWGQTYTIEQITEHAIVHILRHRRQIEKFRIALRN